ncbi:MAG: hypothetical protein PHS49_04625 [Candidatus Gracilibacteria bacterium]|nr:hypothetical protein [Candidatus Gracilibacteria bacterium]
MIRLSLFRCFIFFLIFIHFITNSVSAEGCTYKGQIEQCIQANESGTTRSIEDFVCIVGTPEEVTYQVILDSLFKKLDDEMDLFIENLESNKNTYFGIARQKTFIDGLNEIDVKKEYFQKEYADICGKTIIQEAISCNEQSETSNKNAKNYFVDTDCMRLVDKKLEIFDEVSFNILMLNKKQIKADEKKTYVQGQRKNYDMLIDIMNVNLSYIERIWQKWPSKIQNAY